MNNENEKEREKDLFGEPDHEDVLCGVRSKLNMVSNVAC